MTLLTVGINHQTAPVEIRERVAFAPEEIPGALQQLVSLPQVTEAAILSTCNRTEILCYSESGEPGEVIDWLSHYHKLPKSEFEPYAYIHVNHDAVHHLLRVASGLDSMILGEPQILGQLKDAYRIAHETETTGKLLTRLFHYSFSVAKQVRTDTAIGASPVSVAFAAIRLAKQIFSDFSQHTALLIGAGDTIELAARHLKESGIGRMIIANRTLERAHVLARDFGAYAIALGDLPEHLSEPDIVISSTASQLPILGKGAVETAIKQRKRRPMLMIDIAVPRDIEPQVGELEDVYLFTVDDLQNIIEEGLKTRKEAAQQATQVIDSQALHFMGWVRSLDAVSTIRAYREQADRFREDELTKARRRLARGDSPVEVLQRLAHALTNKLTHSPSAQIRQAGYDGRVELLAAARELLDIKESDS
jgi:glutamyl-tRNA reductase